MEELICSRCGNQNKQYFGVKNGIPYCRRCISFQGKEADINKKHPRNDVEFLINYSLSDDQKRIALSILGNYQQGVNTLVYAVCGAGKTELVFEVIKHVLNKGGVVAFATPRRDVALELYPRFKSAFKMCLVTLVCGGHTNSLTGDIIVLTTHQLYRYKSFFDLVIVDEIDAFPYKGNDVLRHFLHTSIKGKYILMTATPTHEDLNEFNKPGYKIETLFTRFHRHPIPVPKTFVGLRIVNFIKMLLLLRRYQKEKKPCLVFVPTISECEKKYRRLRTFLKNGGSVHSKKIDREGIIEKFKKQGLDYLVTTAVLERGVTIKSLQVIIWMADHHIYNVQTLIQIAGRVGRKLGAEKGEVTFLASEETEHIKKAIAEIKFANQHLQNMPKKL